MLILGTISINAMFGENGVLKKAKEQGSKTKGTISESEAKTNQLMQEYENMMAGGVGNEVDGASQDIIDNLKKQIEELQKQNEELKKSQATGDATEDQVLSGATFSTSKGVNLTGTMPSYTSGSQAVTTSGKWGFSTQYGAWEYIPNNGYYSTGHWLNIPWATIKGSLGTATTGNVLSGTTFTSTNGIKLTGTMANRSSTIQTATTNTSNTSASCYRINGSNIEVVPAIGYWGTWDWTKSCIKIPTTATLKSVTYTVNVSSSKYDFKNAYNGNDEPRYYLTCDMNFPHKVVSAICKVVSGGELSCMVGNGIVQCDGMLNLSKTHPTWNTDRYFYFPHRYNNQAKCQVTVWYV